MIHYINHRKDAQTRNEISWFASSIGEYNTFENPARIMHCRDNRGRGEQNRALFEASEAMVAVERRFGALIVLQR